MRREPITTAEVIKLDAMTLEKYIDEGKYKEAMKVCDLIDDAMDRWLKKLTTVEM